MSRPLASGSGTEDYVRELSKRMGEPRWMLQLRLKACEAFARLSLPSDMDLPPELLQPVESGRAVSREAEGFREELDRQGVVFMDLGAALKSFPELVRKHFSAVAAPDENPWAALNTAAWSSGLFVYVPKGVEVAMPLEAFIHMEERGAAQFERTLIIADEGAKLDYIEGCTAPGSGGRRLNAGVVELVAMPRSRVRFMTLQSWPRDVFNLTTKRGIVHEEASIEWRDANLGSRLTFKRPALVLAGPGARGEIFCCAVSGEGQRLDLGGELVIAAPRTSGRLRSRLVVKDGGRASFRSLVTARPGSWGARLRLTSEALLLGERSRYDAVPSLDLGGGLADIEREESVQKLDEDKLFYLMSRGLKPAEAAALYVGGFFEPFSRELPLEYSVEFHRLLELEMENIDT